MILTDLWFSNFRNHTNLHIKLNPGVTGIVGENGSGKSSIIEGIQFLLTGELFEGTKEAAINVDTVSGYVAGAFMLDGKKGKIERHLDSSKVILNYGGKEYKKSGEVKDLWDKLLQLNSEIIKRVVIARQGHIPQLFSGDPSVREKVFQRIFLVPPTEKIRASIWKDYLKQAPPIAPEEDRVALIGAKERLEAELTDIQNVIDSLYLLSVEDKNTAVRRIEFINKCVSDQGKQLLLADSLKKIIDERKGYIETQSKIKEKLNIDIDKYQRLHTMLLQQRGLYLQKIKLEEQLSNILLPHSEETQNDIEQKIATIQKCLSTAQTNLAISNSKLASLVTEEKALSKFNGLAKCPTCKQDIHDIVEHLKGIAQNKSELQKNTSQIKKEIVELETALTELEDSIKTYKIAITQQKNIESQISQLKNLTFDEEALDSTTAVIKRYGELKAESLDLDVKIAKLSNRHDIIDHEIQSLSVYDGADFRAELDELTQLLADDTENHRKHQQLNVEFLVKQAEIKAIHDRIKVSEAVGKKNEQRNKYVEVLTKMYDVLHSSQFPRKLIMSYADIVSGFLQDHLASFDIPYTARVADNFNIEILDEQDRVLPRVSGGQEIMVGISLHLALHDLFSQSFPLMIIDEGTTHLDGPNRKAYFDIIKGLKDKSKLKQILIIDHDPQLSDVVDHVVTLKK